MGVGTRTPMSLLSQFLTEEIIPPPPLDQPLDLFLPQKNPFGYTSTYSDFIS